MQNLFTLVWWIGYYNVTDILAYYQIGYDLVLNDFEGIMC